MISKNIGQKFFDKESHIFRGMKKLFTVGSHATNYRNGELELITDKFLREY